VWNVASKNPISTIKVGITGILNMLPLDNSSIDYEGFLMTFTNGSVGIFNFTIRKLIYLSGQNHNETIFDLVFKPDDQNVFSTCSFDGSIRI